MGLSLRRTMSLVQPGFAKSKFAAQWWVAFEYVKIYIFSFVRHEETDRQCRALLDASVENDKKMIQLKDQLNLKVIVCFVLFFHA